MSSMATSTTVNEIIKMPLTRNELKIMVTFRSELLIVASAG